MDLPLNSKHILVTRPHGLADSLCNEIIKLGGVATHFPVIEIIPSDKDNTLQKTIAAVNDYDIALFISPTAVKQLSALVDLSTLKMKIGAIGESTTNALENHSLKVEIKPNGNNSDALLEHPMLEINAIKNKHIIIFKGESGLAILSDTLISRGAKVSNANLYRRIKPDSYTPLSITTINNVDVILTSSGEGLNNLASMTDNLSALLIKKIIVPGERCANIAHKLGFKTIITSQDATNTTMLNTLLDSI